MRARYLDYAGTSNAAELTYSFGADGRFSLAAPVLANVGASFAQRIERRDSSSFPDGTVGPVRYREASAYARGNYDFGIAQVVGSADFTRFDFSNASALDEDQIKVGTLDQKFRDHQVARVAGRVAYNVFPRVAAFGQASYASFKYDDERIPTGLRNRDGNELQLTGGVTFDIALLRGEIGVGYVRHSYNASEYRRLQGFALDARIVYFMTPLVTVTVEGARSVEETALIGSSGFFSTRYMVRADYELLRNLILNAGINYRDNEFKGVDRRDRILRVSGGARFLANRRMHFDADFFVIDRNVSGAVGVSDFTEFRAMTGVTFRI